MNTAAPSLRRAPRPQPLALALAACSLLTLAATAPSARAQALPGGLNVVHGQAQVNTAGKTMTVTNSNGAILNWQSFSIGAGQTVRFQQSSASSQVLNRVVGKDASSIFGNLTSNGKVWLLNPNGVLFGQSARINVAGLVVSTLNLADNDFLANRYSLASALPGMAGADIVNQGELRTTLGGRVALLAGGDVRNEGLIDAPGGQVLLAAGRSIDLVDTGVPNLTLRVSAPAGEALNMGSLAAAGGRVDLQAAIVNQQGVVRADALAQGPGGEIVLRGSQAVNLAAGSVTSAAGGTAGGRITVDAGPAGTTLVAGRVDATARHGVGGDVRLLGRQVGLVQAGAVDVSGATGGGQVKVGGGLQGKDSSVPNAEATFFSPDASIRADATEHGNGGRVILWSNEATRAYGTLSAMGGPQGGDGGFIETSGGWLDAAPRAVSTQSRAGGKHGEWLLDPNNILIQDSIGGGNYTGDPDFTSTDDDARIDSQTIIDALNGGNNVTVTTTSSGTNSQAGDITVSNANIFSFSNVPTSLSLLADRDIIIEDSTISGSSQPLSVTLTAARNGGVGRIAINNTTISTSGGDLTLGGNASAGPGTPTGFIGGAVGYDSSPSSTYSAGVAVIDSTLTAGVGTLRIAGGNLAQAATGADGVTIASSSLNARDILIDGYTTAPTGLAEAAVHFTDGSDVVATHALTVNGTGSNTSGILVDQSSQLQVQPSVPDSTASFTLTGTSLAGGNAGVLVDGGGGESDTLLALGSGASMTISGSSAAGPGVRLEGAGSGTLLDGELGSNVTLASTSGNLELDGTSVLAPDGGSFTASSVAGLSMIDSDVFGVPASASFSAVGTLSLDNATLNFADSATAVTLSAQTPSAGLGTLTLTDAGVFTAGKIDVRTDSLNLLGSSALSAGAAGDAIVIAGTSANPNVQAMVNEIGDGALQVNTGARWLVYLTDPASSSLAPGLDYDFKQYASSFDDAVFSGGNIVTAGTGKGLMYAITPTVTITGSGTKTYDATTPIVLNTGPSFTGLVAPNDQAFLDSGAQLNFTDANAGSGKPITIGGTNPIQFSDGLGNPVYGYAVNNQLSGTITPAPLTINTVNVATRNYDGTTLAGVTIGGVSGYVGSETLAISAGGTFDTKDAGTGKLVTLAPFGLADGTNGGLANNYVLSTAPATASGDITPKPYTVSGGVGNPRVYDGTTTATVSFTTVTGLVGSETLGITGVGDYDTKDVGTAKPISIGSLQIVNGSNGGVVSNYVLSNFPTAASGDVTPRPVAFASVTAANKVYDGNTLATVTLGAATGLVGSETLTLGASGSFDTKDAGNGKTVSVAYTLADGGNGGLAGNYTLANEPATTTADITPRSVFAGAPFALDKAYDGTTTATVSGGPLSGLVGSETLVLNASGNFATKDVGNDQVVLVAYGLADGGNGGLAGNYVLSNPTSSALADIVPKELRIDTASAASKVYDGNTTATVTAGPLLGLVGGETLVVSVSGSFDTKDAGTGKTVTLGGYGLADGGNGGLSSNYTLLSAPATTTADITPKALGFSSVTAGNKVYDGNTQAQLTLGAPTGLVGDETLAISATGNFSDKNAGDGKTVVLGYSAADGSNGGLAGNYSFADAPASTTADITRKNLVLGSIAVADKVYDGGTAASVTLGAPLGLVGTETLVVSASGAFADKNVGSNKTVALGYGVADGTNGGLASNYTLSAPAVSNADITPATLTYVADAATAVAGAALPPLNGSVTGFVADETQSSATTGQLAWTAQVEGPTQVGSYAVLGSGLAAQNYVFTQAEGNATALTVTATPPLTSSPVAAPTETALNNTLATITLPAAPTTPSQGRVLDVLPALQRSAQVQGFSFQSLPVASLSQSALAALLASRESYMNNLFAGSIRRLEENAALADAPACATLRQAMTGDCLITDLQLKEVAQAKAAQTGDARPSVAAAPATPATPATPAPTAPTAPPAVASTVTPELAAAFNFPSKRPVKSASLPQIQRKVAVLIGVDKYSDTRIPQLDNAVSDAQAVGRLFESTLGYETIVIPNASKRDVVQALNRLAVEVSPRDSVVIYYAGHGALVPATGLGYWQLADSNPDRPETWMSNSDINKSIAQFGATQVALISDSCYSGSLVDQKLRGAPAETDVGKLLERKAVVVMSSGGNEPVFDSGKNGHSTFAWNLMNTLEKVSTWQAGGNVFERVRFAVARELPQRPQYGTSAAAGHQAGGDYVFEQRQLVN